MRIDQFGDYRTATYERTLTRDDLAEMADRGVVAVDLLGHDPQMDVQASVDVLAEAGPPLKAFNALWTKVVPVVPEALLRNLEQLSLSGRAGRRRLQTGALPALKSLHASASLIEGSLSACPSLEHVWLDSYRASDLAVLDGCKSLRRVRINGRRTRLRMGWTEPPAILEELETDSVFPAGIDGLGQLPALRRLDLWATQPPAQPDDLDFAVLQSCPELDYLHCRNVGRVRNAEAIADRAWRSFVHD
ncbi:hypothetical protein [uncultured Cellulomonas sp.]|uniref:hypothetical protein n=1 Tax=uncultured Cellulomonas sp. TaxID=189682 RepID=UPI00262EBE53|nr:hypothetical protein [uncultured Cellulomonas sp.]